MAFTAVVNVPVTVAGSCGIHDGRTVVGSREVLA